MKLRYVKIEDIIDFIYLRMVITEAQLRHYPISDFIITKDNGTADFNRIVDWLRTNYPKEFEIDD